MGRWYLEEAGLAASVQWVWMMAGFLSPRFCLPLSSALDFELAAILVPSHHMFLLDSAYKHNALVPIRTNTLQLTTPKQRQQHSCLKDLLEVN